jgi:hypothetical protein
MLARFPNLELALAPHDVRWSRASFMRSVEALPIKWR